MLDEVVMGGMVVETNIQVCVCSRSFVLCLLQVFPHFSLLFGASFGRCRLSFRPASIGYKRCFSQVICS